MRTMPARTCIIRSGPESWLMAGRLGFSGDGVLAVRPVAPYRPLPGRRPWPCGSSAAARWPLTCRTPPAVESSRKPRAPGDPAPKGPLAFGSSPNGSRLAEWSLMTSAAVRGSQR
jgi:hypothetical protein